MASLRKQIIEVTKLNEKALPQIVKEIGTENPAKYLSKGKNFQKGVYYHNASSRSDRKSIIRNGFDFNKTLNRKNGFGHGLFCGRDRQAVMGFYTNDLSSPKDLIVTIHGKFRFKSITCFYKLQTFRRKFISPQTMVIWLHNKGYDGIRYYDSYCTGEEFVLYNLTNARFY